MKYNIIKGSIKNKNLLLSVRYTLVMYLLNVSNLCPNLYIHSPVLVHLACWSGAWKTSLTSVFGEWSSICNRTVGALTEGKHQSTLLWNISYSNISEKQWDANSIGRQIRPGKLLSNNIQVASRSCLRLGKQTLHRQVLTSCYKTNFFFHPSTQKHSFPLHPQKGNHASFENLKPKLNLVTFSGFSAECR